MLLREEWPIPAHQLGGDSLVVGCTGKRAFLQNRTFGASQLGKHAISGVCRRVSGNEFLEGLLPVKIRSHLQNGATPYKEDVS